jgi:hypothetical protein
MQTYWLSMKIQSALHKSGTTDSSADNDDGNAAKADVDDSKWVEAGLKEGSEERQGNL